MEITTPNSEADICNLAQCLAHCHGLQGSYVRRVLVFSWERHLEGTESGVKGSFSSPTSLCLSRTLLRVISRGPVLEHSSSTLSPPANHPIPFALRGVREGGSVPERVPRLRRVAGRC